MIKRSEVKHARWSKKRYCLPPEEYVCPKPFKWSVKPVFPQLGNFVVGQVPAYCWQSEVKKADDKHDHAQHVNRPLDMRTVRLPVLLVRLLSKKLKSLRNRHRELIQA